MKKPPAKYPIDPDVQRRLDALERLIDKEYGGQAKVFQDRTDIRMAQVNQWFTGYRALRDKALRRLEAQTGKQRGFFDLGAVPQEHGQQHPEESMDMEHAEMAVTEALAMLRAVLNSMDDSGRESAAAMLKGFANDPTEQRMARVAAVMVASIPGPPGNDPDPASPDGKTKKSTAAEGRGKAAKLVLKIGGGNTQQFSLPLQSLHKATDNRNATAREREWYKELKFAPKANG
ncbi:MAG: hypothetical protein V4669_13910 [Pseudomonadota bacterium]